MLNASPLPNNGNGYTFKNLTNAFSILSGLLLKLYLWMCILKGKVLVALLIDNLM